jgi:hypothetical protein
MSPFVDSTRAAKPDASESDGWQVPAHPRSRFSTTLADVVAQQPKSSREIELWRLKRVRELRCVAVHLSNGIDVRLLEADEFWRTQFVKDAPADLPAKLGRSHSPFRLFMNESLPRVKNQIHPR